MAPGLAIPSNRAAILTPSPIRSPSLSSTTSPRWMPTRNSMRRSGGSPVLRSTIPFCTSMAQRTASTTLLNSMRTPSPVRLTTRPLCTAMVGSIRSLRSARSRASVRSSSAAGKPAVSGHVRRENGCEFPGLRHGSPFTTRQTSTVARWPRQVVSPGRSLLATGRIRTPNGYRGLAAEPRPRKV